jgi:protein-disulfide isomerase
MLMLLLASPFLFASSAFGAAQPPGARIDLSKAITFEKYILTGNSAQLEDSLRRAGSLAPSELFRTSVKKIAAPVTIVAYTDISCPDCTRTIPFVQAMQNINPLVTVRYILRDDETRAFVRAQTGKASTPTIFVTDADGAVAGDVYVEYPAAVQALIDSSKTDEEARGHRLDLRSGKYDDEIQIDLLKLIVSAMPELGGR